LVTDLVQILLAKLASKFHLPVSWLLHVNMSFIYGAYVPIVMDVIMFNDLFKLLCAHVYVTQVRTHLMAKFKFQNHQQQLQSQLLKAAGLLRCSQRLVPSSREQLGAAENGPAEHSHRNQELYTLDFT
jgi:hypothetical protein